MEQMNVEEQKKVMLDYEDDTLPKPVRKFRPLVYMEDDNYCCVLGPNPQQGVFASGSTLEEALSRWTEQLKERADAPDSQDEVKQYINDMLNQSVNDVW